MLATSLALASLPVSSDQQRLISFGPRVTGVLFLCLNSSTCSQVSFVTVLDPPSKSAIMVRSYFGYSFFLAVEWLFVFVL